MQKLATRIVKGDWEKHKRDKDLEPIPSREARVVNRRTNFQRTAYSASSNLTEKTSQARTQPRTLGQDQDQTETLVPFDEQYD